MIPGLLKRFTNTGSGSLLSLVWLGEGGVEGVDVVQVEGVDGVKGAGCRAPLPG